MENLEVNSELTRNQNANIRVRAEQLEQLLVEHERELAAIGRCWGHSDEVARAFEKTYVPASESIIKACWDLVRRIEGTADNVDEAMGAFDHVEKGNIGLAGRVPTAPTNGEAAPAA